MHISLQSGCNRILNLMRRPYNIEKADRVITKIKTAVPDLLISADIISGFPTETDADHNETLTERCRTCAENNDRAENYGSTWLCYAGT